MQSSTEFCDFFWWFLRCFLLHFFFENKTFSKTGHHQPYPYSNHAQPMMMMMILCCVRWCIGSCTGRGGGISRGLATLRSVTMATSAATHHRDVSPWLPGPVVASGRHQNKRTFRTTDTVTPVRKSFCLHLG